MSYLYKQLPDASCIGETVSWQKHSILWRHGLVSVAKSINRPLQRHLMQINFNQPDLFFLNINPVDRRNTNNSRLQVGNSITKILQIPGKKERPTWETNRTPNLNRNEA